MLTNTTGSTRFPFPHAELTPIRGKPKATTVKQLQKEIFTNTRAVHSAQGGDVNGHLGIAMDPVAYLARAGEPFVPPDHPGEQPIHAANATSALITATNRTYGTDLAEFRRYEEIREAIRLCHALPPRPRCDCTRAYHNNVSVQSHGMARDGDQPGHGQGRRIQRAELFLQRRPGEEIGRLFQGLGPNRPCRKGLTHYFSSIRTRSPSTRRRPTFKSSVRTDPKNSKYDAYDGRWVVT
jgi:hypothetical protein